MFAKPSSHIKAVLLALFVTLLWSSSWVLIKIGLRDIPALTFAGLRYMLATLCLLPFVLRSPANVAALRALPVRDYARLALYGLVFVAVAQGAQFLGLRYLPAVTVSLLLNFTPVVVAMLGIVLLAEKPSGRQLVGVGIYVVGIVVYFYPVALPEVQWVGILIVIVGVIANAVASIMGRGINRQIQLSPLLVTMVSMAAGSVVLLLTGIIAQGLPTLSAANWLFIGWLAVVNTALAFPIWNHTLRTLSAVESSIINSTMLVQVALLAYLFLGETLHWQDIAGMVLVAAGMLVVQVRRKTSRWTTDDGG